MVVGFVTENCETKFMYLWYEVEKSCWIWELQWRMTRDGGRALGLINSEDKEKWDANKVGKGMRTNGSTLKFYKGKVNFGYSTQFESKDEGKTTRGNEKSIIQPVISN